jgi:hypothetical protein
MVVGAIVLSQGADCARARPRSRARSAHKVCDYRVLYSLGQTKGLRTILRLLVETGGRFKQSKRQKTANHRVWLAARCAPLARQAQAARPSLGRSAVRPGCIEDTALLCFVLLLIDVVAATHRASTA